MNKEILTLRVYPMIHRFVIALLITSLFSCGQAQRTEIPKRKFIHDESTIWIEDLLPSDTDTDPDRYSIDNIAYPIGRKFVFDYSIVKGEDTMNIAVPRYGEPSGDIQREWKFVSGNSKDADKIETISITVLPGISNNNQTMVKYTYQYVFDSGVDFFSSTSGVVENEMNTWMHPHRDKYFMILELNPFPFIQKPFKIGTKWNWSLEIGDHWMDNRWKTWSGSITNDYKYEIIGKELL